MDNNITNYCTSDDNLSIFKNVVRMRLRMPVWRSGSSTKGARHKQHVPHECSAEPTLQNEISSILLKIENERLQQENERLQQVNERLQQVNGWLQQTNGELQQANGELQQENGELQQANEELHKAESRSPLICPITLHQIEKLVVCTADGYMYEKAAIEAWCKMQRRSPMTQAQVCRGDLHEASNMHNHLVETHNELKRLKAKCTEQERIIADRQGMVGSSFRKSLPYGTCNYT